MLIDTHCHLDAAEFDVDRLAVIAEARSAGVGTLVVPAVEVANFGAVQGLARSQPGIVYALGIHPLFVERAADEDIGRLREAVAAAIDDPAFVGVGEIGLDHFVPGLDRVRQRHFFEAQLAIAASFGLPVILHVRRAQDAVLAQLRRLRPPGGIAHAFNGSDQQAAQFIGLGFALGFGGAASFSRSLRLRRLAASLPIESIVLETDSPDIPPAWLAGARNTPAQLAPISRVLAGLRGIAVADLAAQTALNAQRVLPRLRVAA